MEHQTVQPIPPTQPIQPISPVQPGQPISPAQPAQPGQPVEHHEEEEEESYGDIIIKTDKPAYSAGEMVTGTVYLDLHEDIPANGVNLKVIGTEKTWILVDGGSQMELKTGNNTLYRNKMPLFKLEGFEPTFEAGQYAFPFSFVLGGHLPGSFEYQDNNLAGRIRYKVKAEVECRHPDMDPIKASQIITILEQVRLDGRRTQGESRQEIKKCCSNKGTSFCRAYPEKPMYNLFEVIRIGVDVDNSKCEVPVTSINASFRCVRIFRDNRGETDTRTILLNETSLPGLEPGQIVGGQSRRLVEFKLIDPSGPPIAPSTSGRLIENRYIVTITPIVQGAADNNAAQIGIDITVVATPPIAYEQIKPPENWCASPMPVAPLVLSDAFRYEQKIREPEHPQAGQQHMDEHHQTISTEAQGVGAGAAGLHMAASFLPLALSLMETASHQPQKPIVMGGGGYTLFNPSSGWNPMSPSGPPIVMSNVTLPGIDGMGGPNMAHGGDMHGLGGFGGGGMGGGPQQSGGFGGGGMGGGPQQNGGGFGGGGMGGGNAQEGGFGGGGMGGGPQQGGGGFGGGGMGGGNVQGGGFDGHGPGFGGNGIGGANPSGGFGGGGMGGGPEQNGGGFGGGGMGGGPQQGGGGFGGGGMGGGNSQQGGGGMGPGKQQDDHHDDPNEDDHEESQSQEDSRGNESEGDDQSYGGGDSD